ncbi:MAG: cyclic nucleotide-binding domain-containing protein [Anaerolineae bacterium]
MSGRVIEAVHACPQCLRLSDTERQALASCGRTEVYLPGEVILNPRDTALYILLEGRVTVQLVMLVHGKECGGETTIELHTRGAAFGWGLWVRPERIAATACAITPSLVVRFDLGCQPCSADFATLGKHMTLYLYGLLQEGGICPPDIQSYLQMARSLSPNGGEL